MFGAGRVLFAEERLFGQAEIPGNAAHKAMTEYAPGELSPIFVFQSVEEAVADARGLA